jgi:peptidoglycan/LPS O-acetylase OafA/YrhL
MSTQPTFEAAPLVYRFTPASEEAVPISEREIKAWCDRLRNLADPLISPEAWATAFVALLVAAIFSLLALPDRPQHAGLAGFYKAVILFFALGSLFLVWLTMRLKKQRQSEATRVADEMEAVKNARLGKAMPRATSAAAAQVPEKGER